jgi:hypothetical protein
MIVITTPSCRQRMGFIFFILGGFELFMATTTPRGMIGKGYFPEPRFPEITPQHYSITATQTRSYYSLESLLLAKTFVTHSLMISVSCNFTEFQTATNSKFSLILSLVELLRLTLMPSTATGGFPAISSASFIAISKPSPTCDTKPCSRASAAPKNLPV